MQRIFCLLFSVKAFHVLDDPFQYLQRVVDDPLMTFVDERNAIAQALYQDLVSAAQSWRAQEVDALVQLRHKRSNAMHSLSNGRSASASNAYKILSHRAIAW